MYNNEFKVIDTKDKAYLLGLIYSDGCVYAKNGSYFANIVLNEEDEYLIDIIISKFPCFRKIKLSKYAYEARCDRKEIVKDLINHGLYVRKSTENKEKLKIPNMRPEFVSHFIRGYFDGDGSVYKQKIGNTKIEIGGTCFNLISNIQKVLYDNKITVNMTCKYAGIEKRKHDFYVIYTSSDKVSKLFAEYIYQNCSDLYLVRKYDKLNFVPEYNIRERLQCQVCNSFNTVFNGFRNNKTRIKCKDCGKLSSITAPQSSNILSGEGELLES